MRFLPEDFDRALRAGLIAQGVVIALLFAGLPLIVVVVRVIAWMGQPTP